MSRTLLKKVRGMTRKGKRYLPNYVENMTIQFYKYQGTGNDFILIDNRGAFFDPNDNQLINRLCDRRFGIGADGLILLQNKDGFDFEMVYFNADGKEGSMCGNGGRCVCAFAQSLGIIESTCNFLAVDGPHEARVQSDGWVELKMGDVNDIESLEDHYVMDTGSPHYVTFVEDVDDINVVENGQAIRYSKKYKEKGINVNFVEKTNDGILVLTYERGVEDETLSCGTGVTAAAIGYYLENPQQAKNNVAIKAKGGELMVRFETHNGSQFTDIWLCGPTQQVFSGSL